MRIRRVSIENFRCFEKFVIDLNGEPRLIIGENAIGKSSLMVAMARALGKERTFQRNDFLDLEKAIDIRVTLGDLSGDQLGVFHDAADFTSPPTLIVGAQAIWDPDAEECESFHGYPTKSYKKSKPVERDAIDVHWISDRRDPQRALQFGARRGLVADVLEQIDVAAPIATAIADIQSACKSFAAGPDLDTLLKSAGTQLGKLIPEVAANAYAVESTASTDLAVLRQLQLALTHAGPSLPIADQSSGLAQLTMFAFSLLIASKDTGAILLVDEPELSLHAHCQRALLRALQELPNQFLIATHSAGLLDRADPRHVVRLHRDGTQIKDARASTLTAQEAATLKRYMTTQNAEAFFARKAILVEGLSDKYAIEALAARRGKNLDAAGVSVVDMSGAGGIKTYLTLLGPLGLRVILAGLCDVSDEAKWSKALGSCGYPKAMDRVSMAKSGFFVCDTDLETVLIASLGTADVLKVIDARGDAAAFAAYAKQPAHSAKPLEGQLHDFLHADNIVYAPLLVDALDLAKVPASLEGIVNEI